MSGRGERAGVLPPKTALRAAVIFLQKADGLTSLHKIKVDGKLRTAAEIAEILSSAVEGYAVASRAEDEEEFCTCGAGHGSGEEHTDWCMWLKVESRIYPALTAAAPQGGVSGPTREQIARIISTHIGIVRDQRAYQSAEHPGWTVEGHGDAADSILALLAASPASPLPQEWRTIESAPKDGTQILAVFPGKTASVRFVCIRWEDKKWVATKSGDYIMTCSKATHWMPLPAAPSPELEKG